MDKKLKIYHLSHMDLDGYGCQAVSKSIAGLVGFEVEYLNSNYGEEIDTKLNAIILKMVEDRRKDPECERLVMITDLNISKDTAEIIDCAIDGFDLNFVVLDHHISGKDVAEVKSWYNLDTTKSGTRLTFDYLVSKFDLNRDDQNLITLRDLVDIVDTYDLWNKNDIGNFEIGKMYTFYLSLLDKMIPRKCYGDKYDLIAREFIGYNVGYIYNDGDAMTALQKSIKSNCPLTTEPDPYTLCNVIESLQVDELSRLMEEQWESEIDTFYFTKVNKFECNLFVVFTPIPMSSGAMNKFLELMPEVKAICLVGDDGTCSFRSNNQLDVSLLAKHMGGGGHKNAAGCKVESRDTIEADGESYSKYIEDLICDALVDCFETYKVETKGND